LSLAPIISLDSALPKSVKTKLVNHIPLRRLVRPLSDVLAYGHH